MCWRERPASRRTNVAALHTVCSHDPASRREHGTEFSTTRNESIECNQQCRCVYIWSFAESLSSIVVGICVSSIPSASSYYPSAPCPRPTANHPHAHQLPNAAAGYDRSLFLRTVELLRELALDPGSLPFFRGGASMPGAMSAGRSFHSVSARWFWYDWPRERPGGGVDVLLPPLDGTGPLWGGGGFVVCCGGRFTTAAVVLAVMVDGASVGGDVAGRELRTDAPTSRWTRYAEPGRSLR